MEAHHVPRNVFSSLQLSIAIGLYLVAAGFAGDGFSQETRTLSPTEAKRRDRLDEVLRQWSQGVGDVRTFRVRFHRTQCNTIFRTRTQSSGRFTFASPDRWSGQLEDGSEHWLRDEDRLYQFADDSKTVRIVDAQDLATAFGQGWLARTAHALLEGPPSPFLLGLKVDAVKDKYDLTITKEDDEAIWLDLRRKQKDDPWWFHRAEVLLDKQTHRPRAVKLHDQDQRDSTVYVFEELEINVPLDDAEFRPQLEGWNVISVSGLLSNNAG
jgi:outer membrane lipoprotein-sorting protein